VLQIGHSVGLGRFRFLSSFRSFCFTGGFTAIVLDRVCIAVA
jgi:hypothetical protein